MRAIEPECKWPSGRQLALFVARFAAADGARKRFSPKAVLAELAAVRYSCVTVRVVDLDEELAPLPEFIVAVPTYVFEGRVIWLGNPSPEELFARLGEAAG